MITDTELKIKGINTLTATFGEVDAERFITLVMREPFNYTKWQEHLWEDLTVEQISKKAMLNRKNT